MSFEQSTPKDQVKVEWPPMMRLTEIERDRRRITLRVEGWIASDDSRLLESELASLLDRGSRVRLECSGVTYVDSRGAAMLRSLRRRRLEIVGCRPFILEFVDRAPS